MPLPALANGHITFGCFNNLAKITPRGHRHLGERPAPRAGRAAGAEDAPVRRRADRRNASAHAFAAHGIAAGAAGAARAVAAIARFIGEYNEIDIVLDPFPYSGGLTTCEALWMGVPTVTLPGEIFASRHSMSHLSNAGLADWVAPDIAATSNSRWRRPPTSRRWLRCGSGLRAQVKASPLCDAPRFGRNLGAALRFAWRDWCDRAATR